MKQEFHLVSMTAIKEQARAILPNLQISSIGSRFLFESPETTWNLDYFLWTGFVLSHLTNQQFNYLEFAQIFIMT